MKFADKIKPNVLIIIDTLSIGGPGKGIFQYIKMANEKYDLNYIICNIRYKHNENTDFIKYARSNNFRLKLIDQKIPFDPMIINKVCRIIKAENINLIQSHGYKTHIIAFLASKLVNIPWISFSHGWTTEDLKVQIYHRLDNIFLRFSECAIAVSPKLYDNLSNIRKKNDCTKLIFNAVENKLIEKGYDNTQIKKELSIPDENIVLGVFGRLSTEKGHAYLLDAIKTTLFYHNNITLIIVGEGIEADELVKRVKKLGLTKYVLFLGHKNDIEKYYNLIDLLVLPSISEGLPNVVLESMLHSKPVLATDVGAINEVITNNVNGWIVPAKNSQQLSNTLTEILYNKELLFEVSKKVKSSLFPKFSAETRMETIMNVYMGLINKD